MRLSLVFLHIQNKALISKFYPYSASWGSNDPTYSSTSSSLDGWIYDHDDAVVVIAAGNYASYSSTNPSIASPATAKNVIAVGATESEGRDITSSMFGSDYLAYFSSRGPTADGRIKPDVVAPGFNLLSAGSRRNAPPGSCDPEGTLDDIELPGPYDPMPYEYGLYYSAGTSMATPVVSGTAALIRQYLVEGWGPSGSKNVADEIESPSASLVKAILINGATSLKGKTYELIVIHLFRLTH